MGNNNQKFIYGGQDIRSTVYYDHETSQYYQYEIGENVLLHGDLSEFAERRGYLEPVGKIIDMKKGEYGIAMAQIRLFRKGEVKNYGDVGLVTDSDVWVHLQLNIRPLPIYLNSANLDFVVDSDNVISCKKSISGPWGCTACFMNENGQLIKEQSNKKFQAIVEEISKDAKPGKLRYYIFVCPKIEDIDLKIHNDLDCMVSAFCVYNDSNGRAIYRFVSAADEFVFQTVCLHVAEMKLDHVFYRSIEWTRLPSYMKLKLKINPKQLSCEEISRTYIIEHLRNLIDSGYQRLEVKILPEYAASLIHSKEK